MKSTLLCFLLLVAWCFTKAQVKTDFNNHESITAQGRFKKNFRAKAPYVIPAKDIKALFEKEIAESKAGEPKPFRIAEAVLVDIDVIKEAVWVEDGEYAYGKFSIVAAGAKSISTNFDQFYLPRGSELFVYSENGEMITGPVTDKENNDNNFWGSWVYKGDLFTVDFRTPIESKTALKLHIASVAYGYKELYVSNFGESAACNVNVLCPIGNGWENERNSVALILNGSSTALCSGALLNNTCNLSIPYLLTANHCFDGNATNWKFTFQAWSASCNPSQNANGITFNGSTLRAQNSDSDFCLVELAQMPPGNSNITLSGWNRNANAALNTTGIHHPAGDVMKISIDANPPVAVAWFTGATNHWRSHFQQGTVQPGSSGSPLFDQNHRVVGQLHGDQNNQGNFCAQQIGEYGKFDVSWTGGGTNATRLSNWLDPNNTGVMTTNARGTGISGPGVVCTTAQYGLAGQNVAWLSTNPSGLSIDALGFATRGNNFNGQVTVSATINGPCGNTTFSRAVQVGAFAQLQVSVSGPYVVCPGNWYTYTASVPGDHQPGYTYQWNKPSSWYVQYQSNNSITFSVPYSFGGGVVSVSANNGCGGSSPASGLTVSENYGCYSYSFNVSPNPVDDVLTVELAATDSASDALNDVVTEYDVELISYDGQKMVAQKSEHGQIKIDTNSLRKGLYLLRILHNDELTIKRVVLK